MKKTIVFLFIYSSIHLFIYSPVLALCPPTDYDCQIKEEQQIIDALGPAQEKNKEQLADYKKQIETLQKKIISLETQFKQREKEIAQREIDLKDQEILLSARLREVYKRSQEITPLFYLFTTTSIGDFSRGIALRQMTARQDMQIIGNISDKIISLKKDKESLKRNQTSLANLKTHVAKQAEFLAGEVAKTDKAFSDIRAKQQALLALKAGGFSTSVGDSDLGDDPASRPDYNPGFSPAFAVFSFGAPHRKGMSQYGAYGRAKSGQSAEDIIRAYYGGVELKKDYSTSINIRVSGYGTVDIETYTKRIYEMPSGWGDKGGFEALKAQAVAARSYALAYTNNGSGSICATESCQVYKPSNKGGKWEEAVNTTRGWVLVSNGQPFSAWYASTAGGYTFSYTSQGYTTPGLWDTPNGKDGWPNNTYEQIGGSPWFYKGWYTLRSGSKCGRSHPWLNEAEFNDIVNAILIYKGDPGAITHLSMLETGGCSTSIPDTWSRDKVKEEASKYGGPVSVISGTSVLYANDGSTMRVYLETDKGRKEFTGEEFKQIYNLRAPGAIGIKSSLFNVVRK